MIQHVSASVPPTRAVQTMRWLVLIVIMFGTVISSVGFTISHGLAAIESPHQSAPISGDESHEHANGGHDEVVALDGSESVYHPQHSLDHSHDKAHAAPVSWGSALPQLLGWKMQVRPWIETVQASRLERPPMG